ncbi:TetR family transcriptional regulator [Nocardia sp. NBC_01499]|uniref:TetR/AcrR family transcriptional regulator n=1 Tax=Nocardia sp. NBC_01499 TaxID=2903597 RepID=UPI003870E3DA
MTATNEDRPARSGRRPGQSGAREAILRAARDRFSEGGFDKTSIRAVAGDAGVDPALVHHYFGTKQGLFAAVVQLPVDPEIILRTIDSAPLDRLGEAILRGVLGLWDSPAGPGIVAMARSIIAGGENALARTFLLEVVFERVRQRIATPEDDARLRITLAASQMIGLLMARKVIELDPIATHPQEGLITAIAPTIQRYLTGEIGTPPIETRSASPVDAEPGH